MSTKKKALSEGGLRTTLIGDIISGGGGHDQHLLSLKGGREPTKRGKGVIERKKNRRARQCRYEKSYKHNTDDYASAAHNVRSASIRS